MPQRRLVLLAALLAAQIAAVWPSGARADDVAAAVKFRSAELEETAFGRLDKAATFFLESARDASGPEMRARAELRAGSCLRRLGKIDEAKALLAPLGVREDVPEDVRRAAKTELETASAGSPSEPAPEPPQAPTDLRRIDEMERELEETRAQLDAAFQREQGLEKQTEELAKKHREQDAKIAEMRAQIAPSSPEEALRVRIEEDERRRLLSRNYATFARRLHQEGRFAEARTYVYVALEKDPENAEAKALLSLVSAPLGIRERLYEEILGVLALGHEVRGARIAVEADALVAEATRRQERGEYALSVAPLEKALSLVESGESYLRDPAALARSIRGLLGRAQANGAQRSATPPAAARDLGDEAALAAVRGFLANSGSEVARGLELRFHDGDAALGAGTTSLPPSPVGPAPDGWTLSAEGVRPGPMLVGYLRAADPDAFAAPGASLTTVGSTIVALCDAPSQIRLRERLNGLIDVTAPSAELRVAAFRMPPGEFGALLDRRGLRTTALPGGARSATVPAADLDAMAPYLSPKAQDWGVAALRATPLAGFRLVGGTANSPLSIEVLPVTRPSPGVGVRVVAEWTPPARQDGARMRQETTAGAVLPAGAAIAIFGLTDPGDPERDLVVLVRLGGAPATSSAPLPPSPPPAGLSSSEMLLPSALRGLTEVGPVPIVVPAHPVPTREQALKARLTDRARTAKLVEVKGDRIRVVGGDDARGAARQFLAQIDVVRGVQSFDVQLHVLRPETEERVLNAVPKFAPASGTTVPSAVLRGDDLRQVELLLASAKGRLPLLQSRVSTPPTGRADAAYVVRSAYRRGLELAPGADPAWGRSETALADEGVLVAIRPWGRTTAGRVEFDLGLRAAWVDGRGERRRSTPLGAVDTMEPALATWWSDLTASIADDEALVILGLQSPFAAASDRTRLAVVISNAPPR